jgi:hypothetical protein
VSVALQNGPGTGIQAGTLQGQLVPWSATSGAVVTAPVAKLLKVNSPTKITIGGLAPFDAAAFTAARN